MNDLQIFTYQGNDLRTIEKDGEIWWVLKDVCEVLGIAKTDSVTRRLDDDEKDTHLMSTPSGTQNMTIINEPGLYNVILRSDKPEAKDFKRWVTHDVLPSIRKTGAYVAKPTMTLTELVATQAQLMVDFEKRMDAQDVKLEEIAGQTATLTEQTTVLTSRMDNAVRVFSRPNTIGEWKIDTEMAIRAMSSSIAFRGRLYAELDTRAGCNLNVRLTRARNRLVKNGMTKAQANKVNKLDIIGMDKNLRNIFDGIIREHQAVSVAGCGENVQAVIDADFVEVG